MESGYTVSDENKNLRITSRITSCIAETSNILNSYINHSRELEVTSIFGISKETIRKLDGWFDQQGYDLANNEDVNKIILTMSLKDFGIKNCKSCFYKSIADNYMKKLKEDTDSAMERLKVHRIEFTKRINDLLKYL